MTVRQIVRQVPGARRASLLRQRLAYRGSAGFWERNYARGRTSGTGSYGALAAGKAAFLNAFVRDHDVQSVIEFGCGDGNQLALACYPRYVGLDVSRTAIGLCVRRFAADPAKSFFLYDGECFADRAGLFTADLAISLDVVYHLTETAVFECYLAHLFGAAGQYVIVYSTNEPAPGTAPHVRHQQFTDWVEANCPQWRLTEVSMGPNPGPGRADFFCYARAS
jgi:SAM-dependent methyltransferase